MATRPKLPVRETVPDLFAQFMREVVVAIDENDEAAWMESDDLLQCERAYGGLYDENEGRYGFTYFVDDDEDLRDERDDICWDFDLNRQEIRDIASGTLAQINLWRCEPDCRRRFPRNGDYCPRCDHPHLVDDAIT